MINFTIKTIGCKVNTYESNKIRDELIKLGLNYIDVEEKDNYKDLDFYIVNTCSVTRIADRKSRQMLHLAKKYNPNVIVIAVGCLVDSLSIGEQNVSVLDGVDYLLSNHDKGKLTELVIEFLHSNGGYHLPMNVGTNATLENFSQAKRGKSDEVPQWHGDQSTGYNPPTTRIRAFIKIQDGCNQYCTYCIIPYLRGSIKSRDNEDIIEEIKKKAECGVKEIVLTGIHLSSFGLDRVNKSYENEGAIDIARKSLLEILNKIAAIDGIERIRLSSLEPRIINDDFLKGMPDKFCANFCLSLQSGCDKILRNMNRHYTTKDFEEACEIIRRHLTSATITTDVIVGFPGETEEDFRESLEFVKRMRFYNPNIFPYSRRQGTIADKMDGQLTNEEKHQRAKIMIAECEKISKEIEEEYNYTDQDVLIEETIEEDGKRYGVGYTKEYIKRKVLL